MPLLHLLPSLDYSAAGRQVGLLAPILREQFDLHVAALGPDGPLAAPLRAAGVPVHALGAGPSGWYRLARLVGDLGPTAVHAWRLRPLRAAGAMRELGRGLFRLVASEPWRGGRPTRLDRRLLENADVATITSAADADALHRLDVPAARIRELPPAVAPPPPDPPLLDVPLPAGAKVVMCVGALTLPHGFRDAVWAADILRYPVPDLHLVVVGDGPDRGRLERFARGINPAGGHAHFLPARPDAATLLARADIVWVPSQAECGRQVLLEAMAAGRPVVATALPGLAALVADGQTGLLAPPGDPAELARRTRPLLDDPARAARLGAAAREAVAGSAPERVAPAYAALYRQLGEGG